MGDGPNNGKFSVVRHEILDDTKFESVYGDDAQLATWLRLLIEADKTWPAPAAIPYGTKPRALKALAEAQLIDLLPHSQFSFRGMAAERARRAARFREAAKRRWEKTDASAT